MLAIGTTTAIAAYKQLIAVFNGRYKRIFGFYNIFLVISRQGYLFNNSFNIFITYNNAEAIAA